MPLLEKYPIVDIRGRGLMSAMEFGGRDGSLDAEPGTAAKLVKAAGERGLLILQAGAHVALLPHACTAFMLTLSATFTSHAVSPLGSGPPECPANTDSPALSVR